MKFWRFVQAELRNRAPAIAQIVRFARENPGQALVIEGHADHVGGERANAELSSARAKAVVDELVHQGVPAARLESVGHGSARPVASNDSEAGRARNRRVTLRLAQSRG